ncbi:MAG: hypothetical protein C4K47_09085 [Candidatus Thorarchaeota archaeon]|nr:MAG: hypothetical protein C4K47_09085 [Candidatus Thorarchaeota archaeon]
MVFAAIVVLSFAVPESSGEETTTTMGTDPKILLPFPPGAQVVLSAYWSFTPNVTYDFSFWVDDSDGIDCVIVRYMLLSQSVWHNISATATEGNATRSYYETSFTGSKEGLDWKVFANDSMGHYTENGTIRYLTDTFVVDPKIVLVIVAPVWLVIAALVLHRGRRQQL